MLFSLFCIDDFFNYKTKQKIAIKAKPTTVTQSRSSVTNHVVDFHLIFLRKIVKIKDNIFYNQSSSLVCYT